MPPRKGRLSNRRNDQSKYHRERAAMRRQLDILRSRPTRLDEVSNLTSQDFCGFDVRPLKPHIRVLSLFDGIATALYVLDTLDIDAEVYFSCEIDPKALAVQRHRFQDRITRLGSVTDLDEAKLQSLGRIDLLVGGSPCSDLSLVNPRRRGLHDPSSSGVLFYDFVRVRDYLLQQAAEANFDFYWLFENTANMEVANKEAMSRHLGCDSTTRDAQMYLPVKRKRLFWGNIPGLHDVLPEPSPITLGDILPPSRIPNVSVVPTLTTSSSSQRSGSNRQTEDTSCNRGWRRVASFYNRSRIIVRLPSELHRRP